MKKGDMIKCHDGTDVIATLADLTSSGYGAVADWPSNVITITQVPEEVDDEEGR